MDDPSRTPPAPTAGAPVDAAPDAPTEERFAAAADAAGAHVWEWNLETGETWYRGSLLARLGYAEADVPRGGPAFLAWWSAQLHPDDAAAIAGVRERIVSGPPPDSYHEYRFRRADGSWATLAEHARRIDGADGRMRRAVGLLIDVSARVEAEARLRAREAQMRALLEHAPVGITLNAPDGSVLYASPRCGEIAGRPAESLRDLGWKDAIHPEDLADVAAEFAALLRGERARFARAYRVVRPDGTVRLVEAVSVRADDDRGAPMGFVAALDDVTERRATEERLRHAQKLEAVGQLAGGVAHDFNNVLQVVDGNVDLALRELAAVPGAAVARELLQEARAAAERAAAITRQLLAFGRRQVLQPRALVVNDVVLQALPLVRRLVGEEVRIEVHLADGMGTIVVDRGQMEQVLLNLATNARDAMRGRAERRLAFVTMTVRVRRAGTAGALLPGQETPDALARAILAEAGERAELPRGTYAVLAVRDTGGGILPEARAHLFEPFFTTKPVGEGSGLGLATSYGIVRQSGGFLFVDSRPGVGATFSIYLPLRDVQGRDTPPEGAPVTLPAVEAPAPRPPAPAVPRAVLVVEDDAPVRRLVRRTLAAAERTVHEAGSVHEALALWARHGAAIGAVVTDMGLPDGDGMGLVARLRADRPTLPAIVVSGHSSALLESRPATPAVVWLEKPFTARALLAALDAATPPVG